MIQVLQNQKRENFSEPEGVWLTKRPGHLFNAKTANGSISNLFSVEMINYEEPLGYHTGESGAWLAGGVWGIHEMRQHI
jgi:hypothetical protein